MPHVLCTDPPPFTAAHFFVHDNQILVLIFYISKDPLTHAFLQKIHIYTIFYKDNDMMNFLLEAFANAFFS